MEVFSVFPIAGIALVVLLSLATVWGGCGLLTLLVKQRTGKSQKQRNTRGFLPMMAITVSVLMLVSVITLLFKQFN